MNSYMPPPRDFSLSLINTMIWISICLQIFFSVTLTFNSSAVRASSNYPSLLNQKLKEQQKQIKVHPCSKGEILSSITVKYNPSQDSLYKIDQMYNFARSLDQLQLSDKLNASLTSLSEIIWDNSTSVPIFRKNNSNTDYMHVKSKNEVNSSITNDIVNGTVASSEIQHYLNHYGTVRVQLNANEIFSLKNSQFDLLLPLYEQKDSLIFTQSSIHRTDNRIQSNMGFGYRWFNDNQMLSTNTFLDYDMSRNHARLGLGGEYWRNFLKLGINTYYHLSGWKSSLNFKEYKEHAANGWDVRLQCWLPSVPQLNGRLIYEQYYGDEVTLFNNHKQQRNPHATTVSINYTPIPLLTFSAKQQQGYSGKNDTSFNVNVNYQLGTSWQYQTNPDAMVTMQNLISKRYDLVDRNSNIVLEHCRKEIIKLKTAELVTGYTGEQKSLGVSSDSKYGLERINWSASSFLTAGGKIIQNGNDWMVVMPIYHSGLKAINDYIISGVAIDKKGNFSNRAEIQIKVIQNAINKISSSTLPAKIVPIESRTLQKQELSIEKNKEIDISENKTGILHRLIQYIWDIFSKN